MNRSELAKKLKVDLTTVDSWIRKDCPCKKRGRQWDFNLSEVEKWRYIDQGDEGGEDFLIREMSAKIIGDFFTCLINEAGPAWSGMVKEIGINDAKFTRKLYVLNFVIFNHCVHQLLEDQLRQNITLETPEIIRRIVEEDPDIKKEVMEFCQDKK